MTENSEKEKGTNFPFHSGSTNSLGSALFEIMPNTGHHYQFIDFDEDLIQSPSNIELNKKLKLICEKNTSGWKEVSGNKWIRFKPGTKQYFNPFRIKHGVWVAVESNIGTISRGSVIIPQENCEEFPYTGQPNTPYAFETLNSVPSQSEEVLISIDLAKLVKKTTDKTLSVDIRIQWIESLSSKPIDVDLVIDFGNTRTTALLLEDTPSDAQPATQSLVRRVQALKFTDRGTPFDKDPNIGETIINSWFVTHQTAFAEFEPPRMSESQATEFYHTQNESIPSTHKMGVIKSLFTEKKKEEAQTIVHAKTKLLPQMFVETSPAMIGNDASNALSRGANLLGGGKCFLSSPKRYAWDSFHSDSDDNKLFWTMIKNRWSPASKTNSNPKLEASVLRLFPHNGYDWETDSPPWTWEEQLRPHPNPIYPIFPNGDSLTWMALAILEQAQRQINDHAYWKENFSYVPRRLRSIQVTYPSGWTEPELNAYKRKWQKALNIFKISHFENDTNISLSFPLDEGVASQLPIVFSEIESMGRIGENWLSLIGKNNIDGVPSARVMTIDIGGGTTDYAIVEYKDLKEGPGVDLEAALLLKDSSSTAGDQMTKDIIESVLLPKLGEQHSKDSEWRNIYEDLFREGLKDSVAREEWKVITRLGFIPIVFNWLSDLCKGQRPSPKPSFDIEQPNKLLSKFAKDKQLIGVDLTEPLAVSSDELDHSINRTFEELFEDLAKFASAFEVDFIIICGKPTEIPKVAELIKEKIPINPLRICVANDYKIGSWYPFSSGGKIKDAKTLTAVGVSLFQAINSNMLSGWNLNIQNSLIAAYRNSWEIIHENYRCETILNSDESEKTMTLMNNSRIGRRLLPNAKPEFIYIIKWKGLGPCPSQFKATFRRYSPTQPNVSEGLQLIAVTKSGDNLEALDLKDFELKLCTLESGEYWIDEARFSVLWDNDLTDEDWKDF